MAKALKRSKGSYEIEGRRVIMDKLKSRKFWICVAAALASLGTGISGIVVGNQTLAIIGSVCTVLSAAIYAFCEAWVDGKAVELIEYEEAEDEEEDE